MLARTFKLAANVEAPVPLSTGGHLVVSLYSDRPDAYVPADQDLLACLAGPFTDTVEKLLAFDYSTLSDATILQNRDTLYQDLTPDNVDAILAKLTAA